MANGFGLPLPHLHGRSSSEVLVGAVQPFSFVTLASIRSPTGAAPQCVVDVVTPGLLDGAEAPEAHDGFPAFPVVWGFFTLVHVDGSFVGHAPGPVGRSRGSSSAFAE